MQLMATQGTTNNKGETAHGHGQPRRWAILLPITSRGSDDVWGPLEGTMTKLVASIPERYRPVTTVHVGIDLQDPVFDNEEARARIKLMLNDVTVTFAPCLVPAYQGKICWIRAGESNASPPPFKASHCHTAPPPHRHSTPNTRFATRAR